MSNECPIRKCPKDDGGTMEPVKGLKRVWRCNVCPLEIIDEDEAPNVPSQEEFSELVSQENEFCGFLESKMPLESLNKKPVMPSGYIPGHGKGGSRSGRRRKAKPKFDAESKYRNIR